jgi:hypothetical protein
MLALDDVIRLLHNYVASVMSLVEHTRRLYNKLYAAGNEFTDYQPRVDQEFVQDPLAQFVQCLRLYCQHYKAPNLDITVSWNQGDARPTRTVSLLVEDLKTFDGWTPVARKYLDTINEKIEIVTLATAYRDKVITFYQWFQSRQEEIHKEEIQRFRDKDRELLLLMLDGNIDRYYAEAKQGLPHNKDDVFLSIFTSKEFTELEGIPIESPQRALRAIALLEERFFQTPQEMKEKIIRLYQE